MDENKPKVPEAELNDAELDAAAGGVSRGDSKKKCKKCENWFPKSSLMGGYCPDCLEDLHRQGVYPPL